MQLTPHFSLAELSKSSTAARLGIDNTPPDWIIPKLKLVAENILEPVRAEFGPFSPSSGYRCLKLNKAIGSSDSSQHIRGEAVDFEVWGVSNITLAMWIRDNLPTWDQILLEYWNEKDPQSGWVHASFTKNNRKQVLTITASGARTGLG